MTRVICKAENGQLREDAGAGQGMEYPPWGLFSCWWAWERTVYEQLVVLKAWQPRRGFIWEAVYAAFRGCLGAGISQPLLLGSFSLWFGNGILSSSSSPKENL